MIVQYNPILKFLILLISISILGCESKSDNNEGDAENETINRNEALKEEVIAIHDEVMPKMGALRSHQKRLTEEAAELETRDAANYKEEIEKRRQIAGELDQAYEGMFVWMRQFRPQLDEMSDEEGRAYLLDQKDKVTRVNEDIKGALHRAEETRIEDV